MKKTTISLLATAAIALVMASCSSSKPATSTRNNSNFSKYDYEQHDTEAYQMSHTNTIPVAPMVADLEVRASRITWSETYTNYLNMDNSADPAANQRIIEQLKAQTHFSAAKEYNCDLIINPLFEVTFSADYRNIVVTITGRPATYSQFRKATLEEYEMITMGRYNDNNQEFLQIKTTEKMDRIGNYQKPKCDKKCCEKGMGCPGHHGLMGHEGCQHGQVPAVQEAATSAVESVMDVLPLPGKKGKK